MRDIAHVLNVLYLYPYEIGRIVNWFYFIILVFWGSRFVVKAVPELTIWPVLASNSQQSSCLRLKSTRITGVHHIAQLSIFKDKETEAQWSSYLHNKTQQVSGWAAIWAFKEAYKFWTSGKHSWSLKESASLTCSVLVICSVVFYLSRDKYWGSP